jgi:D-amino-acid dehydrogenase
MATARSADVLVLGGGVIGLACALALLRENRSVTVLEAGTAGGGASHGNCGTITPSLLPLPAPGVIRQALRWMTAADSPLLIRPRLDLPFLHWLLHFAVHCNETSFRTALAVKLPLLMRARELTEHWIAREQLQCEFAAGGHLQVFRTEEALLRAIRASSWAREFGLVTETLSGDEARAREPALNASVIGALMNPGDAQLRPERYLAELARVVRAAGGTIAEQTPVTGFEHASGTLRAVRTRQGDYRGRAVVWALGAWSPLLARTLGLSLPIQPGKGYSMTFAHAGHAPRTPLVLKERSVCVTAWQSGYRLGSTMEFAGYDDSLNRRRLDALHRAAAEYLRAPPDAPALEEWAGWRPMSSDDLPLIGPAPGFDNLWLATGHGMLGITMGAVTGQLIAEMIAGRTASIDPTPFHPARFLR